MSYTLTTDKTWHQTQIELDEEFRKWRIPSSRWNTNYPRGARLTGFNQSEEDRTVVLEYFRNGKSVVLTMGKQKRAVDNLRVLFLAVQAMRLNEKRGIGELIASAYLQLEGPKKPQQLDPYQVLNVYFNSPLSVCEAAYRDLVLTHHPDRGGDPEKFKQITAAIEKIRKAGGAA